MKPEYSDITADLTNCDGNAFAIIACVSKALKKGGERDAARAWTEGAMRSESYGELLRLAMKTVTVV